MSLAKTATKIDGRLGRSQRSRAAVAEALLALIDEGDLRPTAPRIAARAGVSLRLVFHHFKDLEAVFADAARHEIDRVLPTLRPVSDEGGLEKRIDAFVLERSRFLERVFTMWRAAEIQEPFSAEVAKRMGRVRTWMKSEVERVFASELSKRKGTERNELVCALTAALSMGAWMDLRLHQALSAERSRRAFSRTTLALLKNR
jgi:AcrR family transcriptional regulator